MRLFVGNLPEKFLKEDVYEEFSKFGTCEINYFVLFTQGKFAFIEYLNEIHAKNALLS